MDILSLIDGEFIHRIYIGIQAVIVTDYDEVVHKLLLLCFFHDASGLLANLHRKSFMTKVILYIIPFF